MDILSKIILLLKEKDIPDDILNKHIILKENLKDYTICFFNYVAFKYIAEDDTFILVKKKFAKFVPENMIIGSYPQLPDWIKIRFSQSLDINLLEPLILEILEIAISLYSDESFGCCSRYNECSDALKCVQPDFYISIRCIYKKNLENGKVFYGINNTTK